MGVPKFYRWISERYPCLSEVVKEYQIPEFDNLYLDMNGIIHVCSHPNDDDPKFRITEEKILIDISHYIEALFRLIKPKKVFFMAVDGVAPRAKMNQQRGRRFRSAKEAEDSEQRAIQRGEILPSEQRFDSNCITPGTPFMTKLQQHLKYFVTKKISTDRTWQGIRIYLSGHNTPGEGEHKIMDFIRSEKARPDYDSHTRHCLYGLDADLIMLGMCTHDIHFSLLREEVRFGGKKAQKRTPTFEETTFHLLHLSLLRDYLDHEFSSLKKKLTFSYDLENIIDDWIMMGFLVGNDFIPNLPHLHIAQSSLSRLYQTYMDVLPTLDGYINEGGYLNLKRFEKYMEKLADLDYEHFEEFFSDFKWLETRKPENEGAWKSKKVADKKQLEALKLATEELLLDLDDEMGGNEQLDDDDITKNIADLEFYQNKRDYYTNKLNYTKFDEEVVKEQAEIYVRAIQWTLHYYYNGVCSWSWYYPHHYAPFISDIKSFSHLKLDFDLGEPFLPFQQLLAVLPAASKQFLPKPYQSLMCDAQSPVIDYYPIQFGTDLNGKQQDWEAVVLLPFIDEKRLLEAMRPLTDLLTDEERRRNSHGPCSLFTSSNEPLGGYLSYWPSVFPNIDINYAKCEEVPLDAFRVDPNLLVKGLCKGIDLDICFLGFPTLRYIPHSATLKKAEVKVFQQNSRGESMILEVHKDFDLGSNKVMEELTDCCIFVGWPHLVEAEVEYVTDGQNKYMGSQKNQNQIGEMNKNEVNGWRMDSASVKEHYLKRWGINVGEIKVLVYARQLVGFKKMLNKSGKVVEEKQYSKNITPFALQAVLKDLKVIRSLKPNESLNVQQLFPVKSPCFILTMGENYGRHAEIIKVVESGKKGISVEVKLLKTVPEPDLKPVCNEYLKHVSEYLAPRDACHRLGISCNLLSRITSMMHISSGDKKVNIGLNMKSAKRDEEMPGYTKKTSDGWRYSYKAVETVEEYIKKFSELFDFLGGHPATSEMLQEEDLQINCPNLTLSEVSTYLKSLPSYFLDCHPCGSEFVPETLGKTVEESTSDINEQKMLEEKIITVRPHLLYIPSNVVAMSDDLPPDPSSSIFMLDRVIYVKEGGSVPLGLKGTVVAIILGSDPIYEVLFDSTFEGAYSVRGFPNRVYRLKNVHIINLSHGNRPKSKGIDWISNRKPTAVVHPHQETTKTLLRNGRRDRNQLNRQPMVASGQPPKKPTSINHSPNSPFVPSKPFIYTPVMMVDHKSSISVPNARDGEFQEMWKELRGNKQHNHRVADGGGNSTLTQAAKSLPKRRAGNTAVSSNQGISTASAAPPTNEFSNFLKALENQPPAPRTKAKPLEDLLLLLKTKDSTSSEYPPQIKPGQSIPLEELFKSPTEPKPFQQQTTIQKNDEVHYPSAPRSHVLTLMSSSQQCLGGVPIYNYYPAQKHQVIANVKLPNGITATSRPCHTQLEATEMAAQMAENELIAKLNPLFVGQQKAPVGFTPFGLQPYLVGNNVRPPMMKPPIIFQPTAVRQHRPQQQIHHFNKVRPQWITSNPPISLPQNQQQQNNSIPGPKNPFVPLQVTKQTKSGRGGTIPQPSNDQSPTKIDGSGIVELQKNLASATEISVPSFEDNKNKKKPVKKRKSKLAINFNAGTK